MITGLRSQYPFREMLGRRFLRISAVLSILFWLISVGLPSWRIVPLIVGKAVVPLHYNIHFGIDTVGPWWQVYIVPGVGLLFMLLNFVAARITWRRDEVLTYIIAAATVLIEVILCVAMIFIVYLHLTYAA